MFNDERINAECGRIYSTGILTTVLITFIYALSRTVTLSIQGKMHTVLTYTEAVIFILGLGILLIGAIRFRGNGDERILFEKHEFYRKAAKIFVIAVFGTYILTIPFTTGEMLGEQPHNHLLLLLEVIGYLYLFYAFKTKDININYSFIAENGWNYYSRVFSNIGILWLGLFPPFILSAAWELILHESWAGMLTILFAYLSSSVGLSVEYFFISWIEKTSYDTIDGSGFARGAKISFLVCLAVEFASAVMQCVYAYFVTGNLQNIPYIKNVGSLIAVISRQQLRIDFLLIVLIGLAISHLMSQIPKSSLLSGICRIKMLFLALSAIEATLSPVWYRVFSEETLRYISNNLSNLLEILSHVITITLWSFFIRALTRELGISNILWIIPVSKFLTVCINIFLQSQNMIFATVCASGTVEIASLILLTVCLWKYRGFSNENETNPLIS